VALRLLQIRPRPAALASATLRAAAESLKLFEANALPAREKDPCCQNTAISFHQQPSHART
jgi:hypothetical protein